MNFDPHDERQDKEEKRQLSPDESLADPYQLLGLSRQATAAEIKKAYFAKVREHPPEKDAEAFKRIRAAYDALRTPEAKAATDLFLLHPPVPYEPYKRPPAFDLNFHKSDWHEVAQAYSDLARTDFKEDERNINL